MADDVVALAWEQAQQEQEALFESVRSERDAAGDDEEPVDPK